MKIGGIPLEAPKPQPLVIPHDGKELVLWLNMVSDFTEFDELVEKPKPPRVIPAGQTEEVVLEGDRDYNKALTDWSMLRATWTYIKCIGDSIEWSHIKHDDPKTWDKFNQEFLEVGFSEMYIIHIKNKCLEVCGVSQNLIDEATDRFLALQAQEVAKK